MERAGTASVVIVSKPFEAMARIEAERLGLPSLRLLAVDHPVAQVPAAELEAWGAGLADRIAAALTEEVARV